MDEAIHGGEVSRTFAIITTAANELMQPIHNRMPVVIEPEDWSRWFGEIEGDPKALLHPPADGVLKCWPISARINLPRNNDTKLLDPVKAE